MTLHQVGHLIASADYAYIIGAPLNRMITIHWEAAGVDPIAIGQANGHFLDLLGKTIGRHDGRTAHIWVQENGAGKGGHCHILAHVPAALVPIIARLQIGWLRSISGQPYRRRVIKSEPIGARLGLEASNKPLHARNLAEALSYLLKGADEAAAATFGLTRREAGGRCFGKRCGWSQNIGAKARQNKGMKHDQA